MSRAFITVHPARDLRTAFARWAVAQDPKVRTVSPVDFAVPYGLFTSVPEQLLVGAVVDGHAYVIPDEPEPTDPASGLVLLGVDQPEREGIPGERLPEVPAEAYPPDAVPLDVHPAEAEDSDESDQSDPSAEKDRPKCPDCGRPFKSDRALATHRRQAHPED
ncbi:C2H2-type zinc finger protein [Streptomyces sp. NBC_01728]|uniref:C2H2-type zinc finger protein n=1 Tax=unclassified Streptomyces TaxID=2593676 RepID=UPI002254DAF6|nr:MULTISPECIES: C2H2-type zinc finger protein [unclassified Streptomyces]MCX4458670.1 C2H2-type zinc finger protein [Streptomyces sp. NBC_01719]MCX4498027.1 C2H2-type zinc finger protein [Streptomyces sp. NBC_01728]